LRDKPKPTLRNLWEWISKKDPQLAYKFKNLERYCLTQNHGLNIGKFSLSWFIWTMNAQNKSIYEIFQILLYEANLRGESLLYNDIFALNTAKRYKKIINNIIMAGRESMG